MWKREASSTKRPPVLSDNTPGSHRWSHSTGFTVVSIGGKSTISRRVYGILDCVCQNSKLHRGHVVARFHVGSSPREGTI